MPEFFPWSQRSEVSSVESASGNNLQKHDNPEDLVTDFLGKIIEENDNFGILGNFVVFGEIVDNDGKSHLMVVTSENLPEWISKGMLLSAMDYLSVGDLQ